MGEHHASRVHTEPILLDIGDDVGALIVYTPPDLRGREIEVSPVGRDGERTHTVVDERQVNGRTLFAGVFPALPARAYTLWGPAPEQQRRITVGGGQIVEVDWTAG